MMFATKYLLLQSPKGHETTIHHCPDYCFYTVLVSALNPCQAPADLDIQIYEPENGILLKPNMESPKFTPTKRGRCRLNL
jgi:hypothetical protein